MPRLTCAEGDKVVECPVCKECPECPVPEDGDEDEGGDGIVQGDDEDEGGGGVFGEFDDEDGYEV